MKIIKYNINILGGKIEIFEKIIFKELKNKNLKNLKNKIIKNFKNSKKNRNKKNLILKKNKLED